MQIDPVITDKNGKPVTDLREDEVQIFEDGKPRKITHFSYNALDTTEGTQRSQIPLVTPSIAPPAKPTSLRPEHVHRTIALVVDDLGLSFESMYTVRQALKKFIAQQFHPQDLVAIIRTGGGIGALQQFTTDSRQLNAVIDTIKWNPRGRGGIGSFAPFEYDALSRSLPPPDKEKPDPEKDKAMNEARTAGSVNLEQLREDSFNVGTLDALRYTVRGLRELPGRKSIVLLSDGFRICTPNDPLGCNRMLARLRALTDLAHRASVVIHSIDVRGLATLGLEAADNTSGTNPDQLHQGLSKRVLDFSAAQEGPNYLAQQTGGIAIRNRNDLNLGLKQILADENGYYLIGYRPVEGTFSNVVGRRNFHHLSLKITRPGRFNVRMRSGFYGFTDDEVLGTPQTRSQQLIAALTSPFNSAGVRLQLTSLFANDPTLGSIMRSLLYVRGRDLTFSEEADGWHKSSFDILAVTFGENGVVVDQVSRTQTIRLRGTAYKTVLSDGFTYTLVLPIKKPGPYQLRTALRDASSQRVGSASQFIQVPDLRNNRLALSGVAVRGIQPEVFQKYGTAAIQDLDRENSAEEPDPNASAAVRRFKQGQIIFYALVIYNVQLDKPTGKPRFRTQVKLFQNGTEVFTGKEQPYDANNQSDLKRLPLAGTIRLGSALAPGEYLLQVIVTDLLAKEKYRIATQWIDFEILQ